MFVFEKKKKEYVFPLRKQKLMDVLKTFKKKTNFFDNFYISHGHNIKTVLVVGQMKFNKNLLY